MVKILCVPLQGEWVRTLVGELRSHMSSYIYIYSSHRARKWKSWIQTVAVLTPKPTCLTYKILMDTILLKSAAIIDGILCARHFINILRFRLENPSGMSAPPFYRGGAESFRGEVTCPKLLSSKEVK